MTADRQPPDLGTKLREARERKGVSLRQIANATKISVGMLDALEKNDIKRLPGGIFSRSFVRSYAGEVGLDPEATIQEFIAQFRDDSVTAGHRPPAAHDDHQPFERDRTAAGARFFRIIAFVLPLAAIVAYFAVVSRRPTLQPVPTPETTQASAPAPSAAAAPSPSPAVATSAAVTSPPTDEQTAAQAGPSVAPRLTVAFSVSRRCWISATVDGAKQVERILQEGDKRSLAISHDLVLTAGDAGAVAMTINGVAAKPLGRPGEVVTLRMDVDNFKNFLTPQ
jgi:cytoskeleton protein RodZ